MSRPVKEWIGKTDSTPAPPRVRLRIFQREGGMCHLSGRKIHPGEPWQLDHKIALINGGRNCEENLYPVLVDKHKEKTKTDVAEKSRVADRAKSHTGAASPAAGNIKSRGFTPSEKPKREKREPVAGLTAMQRRIKDV